MGAFLLCFWVLWCLQLCCTLVPGGVQTVFRYQFGTRVACGNKAVFCLLCWRLEFLSLCNTQGDNPGMHPAPLRAHSSTCDCAHGSLLYIAHNVKLSKQAYTC